MSISSNLSSVPSAISGTVSEVNISGNDLLLAILQELRVHNLLLAQLGAPSPDDPNQLRGDVQLMS
jgi:hypothetical protein